MAILVIAALAAVGLALPRLTYWLRFRGRPARRLVWLVDTLRAALLLGHIDRMELRGSRLAPGRGR
jgi:hypothetical protein